MGLITVFDPWKNPLCTCPPKYSLAAYCGCGHGCLYCYASSYIRNFSRTREKKDFLKRLDRQIKTIPAGSLITLANSCDPYPPLERRLKLTYGALKILETRNLRVNLVTKSSLILRDLSLLKDFKKAAVSISLTTLEEKLAWKLEPFAPRPRERLKAVEKLSQYLPVAVRFDPLIYPLNTKNIKKTVKTIKAVGAKQVITSTYKLKPDNFQKMLAAFPEYKTLWINLYRQQGERKSFYTYLSENLRKKLIGEVAAAAAEEKLEFSSCREGFKDLNTAACDGSSLF